MSNSDTLAPTQHNECSGALSDTPVSDTAPKRNAIIIGAGSAGLTAAYELLKRTDVIPIVLDKSTGIGGGARTGNYKGNLIDIGGDRFYSKSDRVMEWWMNIFPVKREELCATDSAGNGDSEMLVKKELSRIYLLRQFFDLPVRLNAFTKLGLNRTIKIVGSYLIARIFPRRHENNLEDVMINRFGSSLYRFFLKDYTEKVWGIPCSQIPAEWGGGIAKGGSVWKAVQYVMKGVNNDGIVFQNDNHNDSEFTLGEYFLYPKLGVGQLWEEVARQIEIKGGKIYRNHEVKSIYSREDKLVVSVETINKQTGETSLFEGDYFFSSMPIKELIAGMDGHVPVNVREVSDGLQYRESLTVCVLLKRMSFKDIRTGEWKPLILKDTDIYIQQKDVKVARLQIFNNWSPLMLKDPDTIWMGMDFFCQKDDDFWRQTDEEIQASAIGELEKLGLATIENVLDATVVRTGKAYPAYCGSQGRFNEIRNYIDCFENLFLIGGSGLHQCSTSGHSELTAMVAVDNICREEKGKENIWAVNAVYEHRVEGEKTKGAEDKDLQVPGTNVPKSNLDLWNFIFKHPVNKWFVRIAIPAIIIQFIIFKFFYPFAGFINGDSFVYLESAYHNFPANTYPIGYSKFLRLISVFTQSDTFVVTLQYVLLQISTLALTFTLFFFYSPARITRILLFGFMLVNPVYLYLANYISSDAFFLSLSMIWFTLLIWIMNRPTNRLILINAGVLFIAFTVRYNALYYPVISVVALLLTRRKVWMNIVGFGISLLLIGLFMNVTANRYFEISGHRQFTPFTGWQMANNALYGYRYIDSAQRISVPPRLQQLDRMVRNYFDSSRDVRTHPAEGLIASTVYMWDPHSPLSVYRDSQFRLAKDSAASPLKKWATVAPIMKEYGTFLIKSYPIEFAKYYLIPNAVKYYAPPVEFLDSYNMGVDSVQEIARIWFAYKDRKVRSHFKDFKVQVLDFYPVLTGTMNVILVLSMISFVLLQGYKRYPNLKRGLVLLVSLWAVNFGFSVFASPIALRFQLFPILVSLSFTFLLMEYLILEAQGKSTGGLKVEPRNETATKEPIIA